MRRIRSAVLHRVTSGSGFSRLGVVLLEDGSGPVGRIACFKSVRISAGKYPGAFVSYNDPPDKGKKNTSGHVLEYILVGTV